MKLKLRSANSGTPRERMQRFDAIHNSSGLHEIPGSHHARADYSEHYGIGAIARTCVFECPASCHAPRWDADVPSQRPSLRVREPALHAAESISSGTKRWRERVVPGARIELAT